MIDLNIVLLTGAQLVGLILQVGILLFSYVKTGKLAPMVVAISTIVSAVLPPFLAQALESTQYILFLGLINLINTGLFVWLIYSLSVPLRRSLSEPPSDVSGDI